MKLTLQATVQDCSIEERETCFFNKGTKNKTGVGGGFKDKDPSSRNEGWHF